VPESDAGGRAEHVLLVAPEDTASPLRLRIEAAGHPCLCHRRLADALLAPCSEAAAAMVIDAGAIELSTDGPVVRRLGSEPWSELPVLLLAAEALLERAEPLRMVGANFTVVTPPFAPVTVTSWLRWAVEVRRSLRRGVSWRSALDESRRLEATLLAVLGHDLRTPLAAAQLSAEVILRASHDEQALRPARRIVSSVQRAQRLLDQLADYVRLRDTGRLAIRPRDTDASEVCRGAMAEVAAEAPDTRFLYEESGDPLGDWDPDRLAQLVTALLRNASQHGAAGEPVRVRLDGEAPGELQISIDNAGELDSELAPRLFEPFPNLIAAANGADSLKAYARAGEGLGLGLFLGRHIARAHGGDLVADARCGPGRMRFVATLPRQTAKR
jgi:signal transduction histidine kinase